MIRPYRRMNCPASRKAMHHAFLSILSILKRLWFVYIVGWPARPAANWCTIYPRSKDEYISKPIFPNQTRFFSKAIMLQTYVNSYDPWPSCGHLKRLIAHNALCSQLRHLHATIMAGDTGWWQDEVDFNEPKAAHRLASILRIPNQKPTMLAI